MTDIGFWGQSWWQGVGVILGSILSIAAIIIAIRQNKKKRLSYKVLISTSLLNIDKQVKDDLKIVYKGIDVNQINIFQIQIINDGKVPIKRDDFDEPIKIKFKNWSNFLNIEVSDSFPKNLDIKADQIENQIIVNSNLINPGDFFTLKIIFDGDDRDFEIFSRIEGLSNLTSIPSVPDPETYDFDKLSPQMQSLLFVFPVLFFIAQVIEFLLEKLMKIDLGVSILYIIVPVVFALYIYLLIRDALKKN